MVENISDAHLNRQISFTTRRGIWKCKKCGMENEVTEETLSYNHVSFYECPVCGGHVARVPGYSYQNPMWECEDCGQISEEENGILWYEE